MDAVIMTNTCTHGLMIGPRKNECYECWYTLPKRGRPSKSSRADIHVRAQIILEAIRTAEKVGQTPTLRELQAKCHLASTAPVLYHLRRLEGAGYLTFGAEGKSRNIQLTDKGRGYPSDTELLTRCLPYLPDNALRRALEERLSV